MLEIWFEIAKTFTLVSLIASLPPGGRHKVEVGGAMGGGSGEAAGMGDESASLDLFLVIEQTCFKSSHLEFPVVPRAVIIPPRAAGKQEVARCFFFLFSPTMEPD